MISLKETLITFLAKYLLHIYSNKTKSIKKLNRLENEIPQILLRNIETEMLRLEYPYYNDTTLMYFDIIYIFLISALIIIICLLLWL